MSIREAIDDATFGDPVDELGDAVGIGGESVEHRAPEVEHLGADVLPDARETSGCRVPACSLVQRPLQVERCHPASIGEFDGTPE